MPRRKVEPWDDRFYVVSALDHPKEDSFHTTLKKSTKISVKKIQKKIQSSKYGSLSSRNENQNRNINSSRYKNISTANGDSLNTSRNGTSISRPISRQNIESRTSSLSFSQIASIYNQSERSHSEMSPQNPKEIQRSESATRKRSKSRSKSVQKLYSKSDQPSKKLKKSKKIKSQTSKMNKSPHNNILVSPDRDSLISSPSSFSTQDHVPTFTVEEFERLIQRIISLWNDMKIPNEDRKIFEQFFISTKYIHLLHDHYKNLIRFKSHTLEVLHVIEAREGILSKIRGICREINNDSLTPEEVRLLSQLFEDLRFISLETISSIEDWSSLCLTKPKPFYWRSINYMLKMESDLAWIIELPFCHLLPNISELQSKINIQSLHESLSQDIEDEIARSSQHNSPINFKKHSLSQSQANLSSEKNIFEADSFEYTPMLKSQLNEIVIQEYRKIISNTVESDRESLTNLAYEPNGIHSQDIESKIYKALQSLDEEMMNSQSENILLSKSEPEYISNIEAEEENNSYNLVSKSYLNTNIKRESINPNPQSVNIEENEKYEIQLDLDSSIPSTPSTPTSPSSVSDTNFQDLVIDENQFEELEDIENLNQLEDTSIPSTPSTPSSPSSEENDKPIIRNILLKNQIEDAIEDEYLDHSSLDYEESYDDDIFSNVESSFGNPLVDFTNDDKSDNYFESEEISI